MKILYLHIGTPKTGTSAIQYFCRRNDALLLEKGILFPDLGFRFPGIGQNRNGYFISHKQRDSYGNRLWEAEEREYETGFSRVARAFDKCDTVLLSDEHMWNEKELDEEKLTEIKERMAKIGVVVRVIVYLRRQDEVICSYWAQQVKEGLQLSFSDYLYNGKYNHFQLDYWKRLQPFISALGRENVIVRCYEEYQYEGEEQTLISDFLNIFGIGSSRGFQEDETVKNISLQGIYLEVKRLLNRLPVYRTKQNFIVKYLQDLQVESGWAAETDQYLPGQRQEYLAQFAEGNQCVAREFFGRESGRLFYDDKPRCQKRWEITPENLVTVFGRVMEMQNDEIESLKKKLEATTLRGKLKKIYHFLKK